MKSLWYSMQTTLAQANDWRILEGNSKNRDKNTSIGTINAVQHMSHSLSIHIFRHYVEREYRILSRILTYTHHYFENVQKKPREFERNNQA